MSVDLRTRVDGPTELKTPAELFDGLIAPALAENAELIAPAARATQPRPLVVDTDGVRYRLSLDGDRVRVEQADDHSRGGIRITAEQLNDLVNDQVTPVGWYSNGTLSLDDLGLDDVVDWWVLLRGALDGRTPHVAGDMDLVDADGAPLDLRRSFTPDDSRAQMLQFLEQAGYLHISGVFSAEEMATVSADMDRAAPRYSRGDGRSWWAETRDGVDRLVRMQAFDLESPATADLLASERLRQIGGITGDGHALAGVGADNRIEALFKPLGVVRGLSDLPWHKDCAQGRHSYSCCSLTVGISVTGADATSGQLRVVAGSHRALMWPAFLRDGGDLPEVDLPTRTGDVTVHLSCTLHMAQEPTERERRVMYTTFVLPPLAASDPAAKLAAIDRLRAIREASPTTVSQPTDPTRPWAGATAET